MSHWRSRSVFASSGATVSDLDAMKEREDGRYLPPVEPFDPLTLSAMQQAALLFMHESPVKRSVANRVLEDAKDTPHAADFNALCSLGFAEWKPGKRLHDLTSEGRIAVKTLEQKLCKAFSIHLMQDGGSANAWQQRFYCPCGWQTHVRASTTAYRNAKRAFDNHTTTASGVEQLFASMKPQKAEAV